MKYTFFKKRGRGGNAFQCFCKPWMESSIVLNVLYRIIITYSAPIWRWYLVTYDKSLNKTPHLYPVNIGSTHGPHYSSLFHGLSSHYHIRNIAKIRKYIDEESAKIVVHTFVTAKLDSCNFLLYGLPQHLILRLQSIQNTAARAVTRTRKFDHIAPVLKQLHWLPVRYRIVFKIPYWSTKLSMEQRLPTSVDYLSTTPLNEN